MVEENHHPVWKDDYHEMPHSKHTKMAANNMGGGDGGGEGSNTLDSGIIRDNAGQLHRSAK